MTSSFPSSRASASPRRPERCAAPSQPLLVKILDKGREDAVCAVCARARSLVSFTLSILYIINDLVCSRATGPSRRHPSFCHPFLLQLCFSGKARPGGRFERAVCRQPEGATRRTCCAFDRTLVFVESASLFLLFLRINFCPLLHELAPSSQRPPRLARVTT